MPGVDLGLGFGRVVGPERAVDSGAERIVDWGVDVVGDRRGGFGGVGGYGTPRNG